MQSLSWGGGGDAKVVGGPGHGVKANAKPSRERERAVCGAENKICSIPSVRHSLPEDDLLNISRNSCAKPVNCFLEIHSRKMASFQEGSVESLDWIKAAVSRGGGDAVPAAFLGAGDAGGWGRGGGGPAFSPPSHPPFASDGSDGEGRGDFIFFFFFFFRLSQLTGMLISLLAVSSSKQIGKPAELHATGLSAWHPTHLRYSVGNH